MGHAATVRRTARDRRRPTALCLRTEALEIRRLLSSNALGWGPSADWSLSFAPDGTQVGALTSRLFGQLDLITTVPDWQEAIVRAFQTWATHTNADIGVVPDTGLPFGSPGRARADSRFGDIRVGAIPMRSDVFAISVPNEVVSGTWGGDLLFNSQVHFANVDEVFRVALHEAGNLFGLLDSQDPLSPLFSDGAIPAATVPTATDIANLHSRFGVRTADQDDLQSPNDSLERATRFRYSENDGFQGATPLIVHGDLTTATDADWYRLDALAGYDGPVTVTLRTQGLSLVHGRLSVHDRDGQELASTATTDGLGDKVRIELAEIPADDRIYLRVAPSVSGVYAIGEYALLATFDGALAMDEAELDRLTDGRLRFLSQDQIQRVLVPEPGHATGQFVDDLHQNDTRANATVLSPLPGFTERTDYQAIGSIADATDIDIYQVASPVDEGVVRDVAVVRLRAIEGTLAVSSVQLENSSGQMLAGQVLTHHGTDQVIQFTGIESNRSYYVHVLPGPNAEGDFHGNYDLSLLFTDELVTPSVIAAGTLTSAQPRTTVTLHVPTWQLYHFALEVAGTAPPNAYAVLRFIDRASGVGLRVAAEVGSTRSAPSILVPPGTYDIEVATPSQPGVPLNYRVWGLVLSDPLAVPPDDPTFDPLVDCPGHVLCFPDASDLNSDGSVDAQDIAVVFAMWSSNDYRADINTDGIVDAADAAVIFGQWTGDARPVPVATPMHNPALVGRRRNGTVGLGSSLSGDRIDNQLTGSVAAVKSGKRLLKAPIMSWYRKSDI